MAEDDPQSLQNRFAAARLPSLEAVPRGDGPTASAEDYLNDVRNRLAAARRTILEEVCRNGQLVYLVAARTRVAWVPVPKPLREVFICNRFSTLGESALSQFAEHGRQYAASLRVPAPWWVWLLDRAELCVYVVALVPAAGLAVEEAVRDNPPPASWGRGWVVPLVYDERSGQLHHFLKVPVFGNAFYLQFKKVIRKWLAPPPPPPSPLQASTATQPAAVSAERARRFHDRLRAQQSLLRAVACGLPIALGIGLLWGAINALAGAPLEWLPVVGVGAVVGAVVRRCGQGLASRFGVAAALLTFLGCLVSRIVSLGLVVALQARTDNLFVFSVGRLELWLRLAADSLHWTELVAMGLSIWQAYALAFRRLSLQEMSFLADRGPLP